MKKNFLPIVILTAIIMAGAGFFGGMKYQQTKQPSRADFQQIREARQSGNLPAGQGQRADGGMVRGEIISRDEQGIIVKLADESSKLVLVSENTEINKATEATIDDLKTGEQVMVFGQTNPDGSLSASQIQLNFEIIRKEEP